MKIKRKDVKALREAFRGTGAFTTNSIVFNVLTDILNRKAKAKEKKKK